MELTQTLVMVIFVVKQDVYLYVYLTLLWAQVLIIMKIIMSFAVSLGVLNWIIRYTYTLYGILKLLCIIYAFLSTQIPCMTYLNIGSW